MAFEKNQSDQPQQEQQEQACDSPTLGDLPLDIFEGPDFSQLLDEHAFMPDRSGTDGFRLAVPRLNGDGGHANLDLPQVHPPQSFIPSHDTQDAQLMDLPSYWNHSSNSIPTHHNSESILPGYLQLVIAQNQSLSTRVNSLEDWKINISSQVKEFLDWSKKMEKSSQEINAMVEKLFDMMQKPQFFQSLLESMLLLRLLFAFCG